MDKVLLSQDDVDRLFAWKDQHVEEVRSMPVPVKSIEIVLTGLKMKLKCIRDKAKLTIHIYSEKMKHGKLEFLVAAGLCLCRKNTVDIKTMTNEHINSILSCYGALMAFMVYEKPVMDNAEPQAIAQKPHRPPSGPSESQGQYLYRPMGQKHLTEEIWRSSRQSSWHLLSPRPLPPLQERQSGVDS